MVKRFERGVKLMMELLIASGSLGNRLTVLVSWASYIMILLSLSLFLICGCGGWA